jgi:hypothetical protein
MDPNAGGETPVIALRTGSGQPARSRHETKVSGSRSLSANHCSNSATVRTTVMVMSDNGAVRMHGLETHRRSLGRGCATPRRVPAAPRLPRPLRWPRQKILHLPSSETTSGVISSVGTVASNHPQSAHERQPGYTGPQALRRSASSCRPPWVIERVKYRWPRTSSCLLNPHRRATPSDAPFCESISSVAVVY